MAAAGDVDEVARLVGMFGLPYYRSGRVVTVERWLKQLDDPELLRRYPEVATFGAFLNGLRGRPDDAERYWFALEHSERDGPMSDERLAQSLGSARPCVPLPPRHRRDAS